MDTRWSLWPIFIQYLLKHGMTVWTPESWVSPPGWVQPQAWWIMINVAVKHCTVTRHIIGEEKCNHFSSLSLFVGSYYEYFPARRRETNGVTDRPESICCELLNAARCKGTPALLRWETEEYTAVELRPLELVDTCDISKTEHKLGKLTIISTISYVHFVC